MPYYKVVINEDNQLRSARTFCELGGYGIYYKIGQYVKPKIPGSGLFVFNSLKHAMKMATLVNDEIYQVKVKHIFKKPLLSNCGIYKFWKLKRQKKRFTHMLTTFYPLGTVMVGEVKLIKRIYPS